MKADALYRRLLFSIVMFFSIFLLGAAGFWLIGQAFSRELSEIDPGGDYQFTVLNSLYMAAITVSTVGYTEATNFHAYLTETGETVATIYTLTYCLIAYLVVIYASANIVAALVEGAVGKALLLRRMRKLLEALKDHYIVCGAGATGSHIVEELSNVGENVVVVDRSESALAHFEGRKGVFTIAGDATDGTQLDRAGISRARGVFAVLHDDKDNLFVVLTTRQVNSAARIIGRVTDKANIQKLKSVGADAVVSPNHIGGLRMASEMIRPSVVSFLDKMLRATDASLRFNEVPVPEESKAAGHCLGELRIREETGLEVIGVYRVDRSIVYNPGHETGVNAGDALIVICNAEQLHTLRDYVANFTPAVEKPPNAKSGGTLTRLTRVLGKARKERETHGVSRTIDTTKYTRAPRKP